jgi:hypothetical protein
MVANTITFQHTAKKDISLCIETSFGFEVVVISEKQALNLAQELRDCISAMPSNFSQEKTGFPGITASAYRAGFNGA